MSYDNSPVGLMFVSIFPKSPNERNYRLHRRVSLSMNGESQKKRPERENIVFRKWKIYVIICNPRASSKTAEHRLELASITSEPDFAKAGRKRCTRGNVVHEFTASIMNLPPTKARLSLMLLVDEDFSRRLLLFIRLFLAKYSGKCFCDTVDFIFCILHNGGM